MDDAWKWPDETEGNAGRELLQDGRDSEQTFTKQEQDPPVNQMRVTGYGLCDELKSPHEPKITVLCRQKALGSRGSVHHKPCGKELFHAIAEEPEG